MASAAAQPVLGRPAASRPAIIHPIVDLLCCGGLSLLVVPLLLLGAFAHPPLRSAPVDFGVILAIGALVNWPHFLASYRLLYASGEDVREHWIASVATPLVLLGVMVWAFWPLVFGSAGGADDSVLYWLRLVGAALLAWHYTGQVWGMVSSFSFITGARLARTERRLIRSGLFALLVWHVLWVGLHAKPLAAWDPQLLTAIKLASGAALLTIPMGFYGFYRLRQRTGVLPGRAIVAWASIYGWYSLLLANMNWFVFLQFFHALQYVIFPMRVELNQRGNAEERSSGAADTIRYFAVLFAVGPMLFVPQFAAGGTWVQELGIFVAASISIHHYLIDGAVWKISNPRVRRSLFRHLRS